MNIRSLPLIFFLSALLGCDAHKAPSEFEVTSPIEGINDTVVDESPEPKSLFDYITRVADTPTVSFRYINPAQKSRYYSQSDYDGSKSSTYDLGDTFLFTWYFAPIHLPKTSADTTRFLVHNTNCEGYSVTLVLSEWTIDTLTIRKECRIEQGQSTTNSDITVETITITDIPLTFHDSSFQAKLIGPDVPPHIPRFSNTHQIQYQPGGKVGGTLEVFAVHLRSPSSKSLLEVFIQ